MQSRTDRTNLAYPPRRNPNYDIPIGVAKRPAIPSQQSARRKGPEVTLQASGPKRNSVFSNDSPPPVPSAQAPLRRSQTPTERRQDRDYRDYRDKDPPGYGQRAGPGNSRRPTTPVISSTSHQDFAPISSQLSGLRSSHDPLSDLADHLRLVRTPSYGQGLRGNTGGFGSSSVVPADFLHYAGQSPQGRSSGPSPYTSSSQQQSNYLGGGFSQLNQGGIRNVGSQPLYSSGSSGISNLSSASDRYERPGGSNANSVLQHSSPNRRHTESASSLLYHHHQQQLQQQQQQEYPPPRESPRNHPGSSSVLPPDSSASEPHPYYPQSPSQPQPNASSAHSTPVSTPTTSAPTSERDAVTTPSDVGVLERDLGRGCENASRPFMFALLPSGGQLITTYEVDSTKYTFTLPADADCPPALQLAVFVREGFTLHPYCTVGVYTHRADHPASSPAWEKVGILTSRQTSLFFTFAPSPDHRNCVALDVFGPLPSSPPSSLPVPPPVPASWDALISADPFDVFQAYQMLVAVGPVSGDAEATLDLAQQKLASMEAISRVQFGEQFVSQLYSVLQWLLIDFVDPLASTFPRQTQQLRSRLLQLMAQKPEVINDELVSHVLSTLDTNLRKICSDIMSHSKDARSSNLSQKLTSASAMLQLFDRQLQRELRQFSAMYIPTSSLKSALHRCNDKVQGFFAWLQATYIDPAVAAGLSPELRLESKRLNKHVNFIIDNVERGTLWFDAPESIVMERTAS